MDMITIIITIPGSLLNIIHLSNFLTTRPSLNNLTTFRALNKEPIPLKNIITLIVIISGNN